LLKLISIEGDHMKKLLTIAFTMLLGSALSVAQATGSTDKPATGNKPATTTKTKSSHHHGKKATKKAKKSTGDAAATTPK
jgi:hypothetical protein